MFVYRVELSNPITKPSMCEELMSTTNHNMTAHNMIIALDSTNPLFDLSRPVHFRTLYCKSQHIRYNLI
jgi:hypothetical protein